MNKKIAIVLLIPICFYLTQRITETRSAIIIDPINNGEFQHQSIELLSSNGYKVEYVAGGNVTVEYLKNLPTHDLYIFRVHSTCVYNRTWIFTGEKYRTNSYPILQITDLIHKAKPSHESDYLFAVSPEFIQQFNEDGFKDGVVLMMGCDGLIINDLAEAFCTEGASIYVSWDGNVCLEHTDQAILALLESLCLRKTTILDAIRYAQNQVGHDPVYYSQLNYYSLDPRYLKGS